jgi:protein-S-isoprenylcysteine O-methyltransferase Ste14
MKVDQDSAQVQFPPPLLFVGVLLTGFAIDWLLGLKLELDSILRLAFGGFLGPAGVILLVAAAGLFRRAGTNLPPWEPTSVIVTTGPYRWTRNPMYVGMTLLYLGLAIGFDSVAALLLLPLVLYLVQTQVIAREERYLEAKFGDSYRSYKSRVRRWL